jgi:Fe-S cluster biogenesis protein NfuA
MRDAAIEQVVAEVVAPLVETDRGELFVVELTPNAITLHLRGRFSGCPGNTLAIRRVIEPALRTRAPMARITLTAGEILPERAVRWQEAVQLRESAH